MQIDLYVNKKFDVIKIIKLVLKRKDWGKTYTLYKTTTHEVLTQMRSYNFTDKYATFDSKMPSRGIRSPFNTLITCPIFTFLGATSTKVLFSTI